MKPDNYKMCAKCIMDTNDDPTISFNEKRICSYCLKYEKFAPVHLIPDHLKKSKITELIDRIKEEGKGKPYDCILGVSGGVDSSYTSYLIKEYGLKPLLVHLDNSWNSKIAVENINNIAARLGLDLHTHVINWEEFRDIQLSFFKASVVDIELVTDYAIVACLYNLAAKHGIKYIISGHNFVTEAIMPAHWTHAKSDLRNILAIQKKFGKQKIRTFPVMGYFRKAYYVQLKKIKIIPILNYTDYNKENAKKLIMEELGWVDYGGKHGESIFTRFYQNYILPAKFGIDKRKAHLSSLISSGQVSREAALEEMKNPVYDPPRLSEDKQYILKKFNLTEEEFEKIMNLPIMSHLDYPSYVTSLYKQEVYWSKKLKPITRPIKKLLNIHIENNYV